MKDIDQSLLDALLSNNVNVNFKTFVNFNSDSTLSDLEDISEYIDSVKVSKKLEGNLGVSVTDNATIILVNDKNQFSPKNIDSPHAGNVVPNRYARIEGGASDTTTLLFDGEVEDIKPSYSGNQVSMKIKDITSRLKKTKCPNKLYPNMYREDIIKDLLDYAGGVYTESSIDKTNSKVTAYFEVETVWNAIQQLAQSVWGRLFVEDGVIYFRTRLSPDYNAESNVVKTLDDDKYFSIKESYTSKDIYNEVTVKSSPLKKQAERVVWRSSQSDTSVSEQYSISDIDGSNQLQLTEAIDEVEQNTTNVPIIGGSTIVVDRTTGIEYKEGNGGISVDLSSGLITFNDTESYPVPSGGGKLDVAYNFNLNILEPNREREFLVNLDNPTIDLSNVHFTIENLTDDIELIPHASDRTITLRGNDNKEIFIYEPHTIEWSVDYQDGSDHRTRSGSYTFTEAQLGSCKIKTNVSVDRPWHDSDDYNMDFQIIASNADVVVSDSESKGEHRLERPTTITLKIKYNHYEYEKVLPPTPDVKVSHEIDSNQKTVKVKLDNKSNKKARLYGYLKDKNDTTEDMILLGSPYTRETHFEYTNADEQSQEAFTISSMQEITNNYLLSENDLKQLANYLLYQYSMPMTILEVKCKPMPDLELMDKVRIVQQDRDIDDIFFVEEIDYTHSKSEPFGMGLKLRQAYQSDFTFEDDGSYAIVGGGEDNETISKPQPITALDANVISASLYGDNKVKLTWYYDKEYNISHYNIYRKDPNDTVYVYLGQTRKGSKRYLDPTVEYNKNYDYKVSAVDKTGIESDFSDALSVFVELTGAPVLSNFTNSSFKNNVNLDWEAVNPKYEYELRVDTNFGADDTALVYRGKETHYTYETPSFLNKTFYLKTLNDNGVYSNSYSEVSVTCTAPNVPSFKFTDSYFYSDIKLSWDDEPSAETYELRRDNNFGVDDENLIYKGRNNNFTTEHFGNRTEQFFLKSINSIGKYSDTISDITLNNSAPPQPSEPTITEFFEGIWIDMQGVSDSDLEGYNIYITNTETQTTEKLTVTTATKVVYKGQPEDSYDIQIAGFDSLGEGALSPTVTATMTSINSVEKLDLGLRPPKIVDTKPTLPNELFPEGATIYLTSDSTLYKNISGVWSDNLADDEYQKILVGTIEAGAVGVEQLQADSVTADAVGANEIVTNLANIRDAVIDELQVRIVTADMITVGADTTYEAGYNPYENSKQAVKIKPQGAKLWHFDKHFTSTQGEMITIT